MPLCIPIVDGGEVERERGVTAANLATAFSHRAKWCPLSYLADFCNLARAWGTVFAAARSAIPVCCVVASGCQT